MLLSTLLVAAVVLFVVLAVQRLSWPAFFALMAGALAYGVLADRHIHAYGRAFSLGFANAIEQVGLLVVVGALVAEARRTTTLPTPWAAAGGAVAGTLMSAAGGLALLQSAADGAPRRALLMVLLVLAAEALILPSPVAVAAAWVLRADLGRALLYGLPLAACAAATSWIVLRGHLPADKDAGRMTWLWAVVGLLLALMLVTALAQVPSEPLGTRAANKFFTNLGRPFVVTVLGIAVLAFICRRTLQAAASSTRWPPLVLTVGAAGGLSFVLNETGAPEVLAETFLDPRLGLLVPFLTAATVKTMQGSSLTAVLTAVGMTEPMLASLGLDTASGRVLAALAAGAGSIALCHVNDPLFWIGAHMLGVSPARALALITGGSAIVAVSALLVLSIVRLLL